MNKTSNEPLYSVSEGGMAAEYPKEDKADVRIGPTTTDEYNTLRTRINPVACLRVDDIQFDFDSSFVRPQIKSQVKELKKKMREEHPGCPISIFGHADPVGNDDYNKQLSDRRVIAICGLLTRNTDLWEALYSHPHGNDDWKKKHALTTMAEEVAKMKENQQQTSEPSAPDAAPLETATAQLQPVEDLPSVAECGTDCDKRKVLFRAYMDAICGPDFIVNKNEEFLARGDDPDGKGDYQGCSEFNPVLLFSQAEEQEYARAKDKTERNKENVPNRRVIVLLFHKGSRVSPVKWPCPTAVRPKDTELTRARKAHEGVAGCHKRFYNSPPNEGNRRRSERLPDERREYSKSHDTFACRFYDRQIQEAEKSLCERPVKYLHIRLYDQFKKFIENAPYEITIFGQPPRTGTADKNGYLPVPYYLKAPGECLVKWGIKTEKPDQPPQLVFSLKMLLGDDLDKES